MNIFKKTLSYLAFKGKSHLSRIEIWAEEYKHSLRFFEILFLSITLIVSIIMLCSAGKVLELSRRSQSTEYLFQLNREFDAPYNREIIKSIMRANSKNSDDRQLNIDEYDARLFLNEFETIAELRRWSIITDEDINNHFKRLLQYVCRSSYFVGENKTGIAYWNEEENKGVKVLCQDFVFNPG